ncbi:MAG TPA: tRNA-dihydrouridine synthase, partial [Burkholderiales bacterium]|nr:tRNA-dihydrouridine synthase [Burkholderiales bacterium]
EHVDGVMLGRVAYHNPWVLADGRQTRAQVVQKMVTYLEKDLEGKTPVRSVARHMLGLYHGTRHAKRWRRLLSDSTRLAQNDPRLLLEALEAVESGRIMQAA